MIKRWMKPPEFSNDERKTQHGRILCVTLLSFFGYLSIFQLAIWLGGKIPSSNRWNDILLLGITAVSYIGLQKGFV
jgi:hypothetical protein